MADEKETSWPDERLKSLIQDLALTLNEVFSESQTVRQAVSRIEEAGYEVELLMASITRITRKKGEKGEPPLTFEFNAFDRDFLRKMKILSPEEPGRAG